MSVSLDELIAYWQGELAGEREAAVEEALFDDEATARRLDAIARLEAGVRALVRAGAIQAGLTVDAVDRLAAAGLSLRTYRLEPGETAPCTIALEDFVVVRLHVGEAGERLDVTVDGSFEGAPPARERHEDLPIDRRTGEVVLVYPGDRIRALPRSRFVYTATRGGATVGEFRLDHTPPR